MIAVTAVPSSLAVYDIILALQCVAFVSSISKILMMVYLYAYTCINMLFYFLFVLCFQLLQYDMEMEAYQDRLYEYEVGFPPRLVFLYFLEMSANS
jgi:hypothetical protein